MYQRFIKRYFDILFSVLLVILFMPVFIIVGLVILTSMGMPIFYVHERPGILKKSFKLIKFRTMIDNSKLSDSERITKVGILLRKTSIDELPQIFNVIKGDMSLIGPRPLLTEYNDYYNDHQNKRFYVKPGISGLAQVSGRNNLSWDEKFDLDVEYVEKVNFSLDFIIFVKTIYVILFAKDFRNSGESKKFSDTFNE